MPGTNLDILRPWIETSDFNTEGETGLYCPMHDDIKRRSASVNVEKGVWFCQACDFGGPIAGLVKYLKEHPEKQPPSGGTKKAANGTKAKGVLSEGMVAGWHSALFSNRPVLDELMWRRGLEESTLREFEIGWDGKSYTIPVRADNLELINVRFYQPDAPEGKRKIWSVDGRGAPVLYPQPRIGGFGEYVIVCEGEWDTLLTLQNGFDAVTRTGSASTWRPEWNNYFRDKRVYLCHDADHAGAQGNRSVGAYLDSVASELYVVNLPYEVTEKHGKDLTDYWMDGHSVEDFLQLLFSAVPWDKLNEDAVEDLELLDADVLETFDAAKVGQKLRVDCTIAGKQDTTYLIPKDVSYNCTMDAGPKCTGCPMNPNGFNGKKLLSIEEYDPMILKIMGSTDVQVLDLLRLQVTPIKCGKLEIKVTEHRSVEELYIRPSVDDARIQDEPAGYVARKVVSVGRHDTMANSTVQMIGTAYPSPRTQHNQFMAWEVTPTETSVDNFTMDELMFKTLSEFQPRPGQRPLWRLGEICKDLSLHVTKIFGRGHMHALMDLVFHSVISFKFDDHVERRGWLDALILGDTRTGKSAAAQELIKWYGVGQFISCEAASFAGVVGGLQQFGGKEWTITWGAIPLNDRRLVVLDEVTGLTTDNIAAMSSIRSSGEAQLIKIRSERTPARTRLLWLANPRDGKRMEEFTYGINALQPLIGNNEDIARFDIAMSISTGEVPSEVINRTQRVVPQRFTQEAYASLLHWAWTRKVEHILWEDGAEQAVYDLAIDMGKRYTEIPPLVQAANIREKICRLAVALATRLFSTEDGESVLVRKQHVRSAVEFFDEIYGMRGFGYGDSSEIKIEEQQQSEANMQAAIAYLKTKPEFARFMRENGNFQMSAMHEMLNIPKEEIGVTIHELWEMKMVTRGANAFVYISPVLHRILREEDI